MGNGNLAQTVKDLRKRKGLSQEELAKKSGLSLRTIQRVENGETEPAGETLKRISNTFDLNPEQLIDCISLDDKIKITIEAKKEFLHIFDNKLIISKAKEIDSSINDYEESVNNIFKSVIVFLIFIPIFAVLATVVYSIRPDLSFYAGGFALFFLLMAIYMMLFTSGTPIINKSQIKSIGMQNSIFGNVIIVKYNDNGILKRRTLILTKDKIDFAKKILLNEGLSNLTDFKNNRKIVEFEGIIFASFFIVFFLKYLFKATFLESMWGDGIIVLAMSGLILFLIFKGFIESYIWRKKQQTANKGS